VDKLKVRLAVLADPHFYPAELGTESPSFDASLKFDTKILRRSETLFDEALALVRFEKPDILLVPGDLTKDGELISHSRIAGKLADVQESGTRVFTIPGNHDLNNPWARSYLSEPPASVKNLTPSEFAALYGKFGYDNALRRDPSSLSYLAEPVPGLGILALDVCDYGDNAAKPVTSGRLKPETAAWACEALREASREGKTVLGLIHHNLLEHHRFQGLVMSDFIVRDWETTSRRLAEAGLKIVFSGHYHTQDVALARFGDDRFLFDVETGSILTFPCPLRFVDMEGSRLAIRSLNMADIPDRRDSVREEALAAFAAGIRPRAMRLMTGHGIPPETAEEWVPHVVDAYLAHTAGDEAPGDDEKAVLERLAGHDLPGLKMAGQYLEALWTNSPPPDNNVTIDLEDGSFA
jgi:hypothetical protein